MMAASSDQVICHVCGFKNPGDAERCVSCGAKLEELSGAYSADEEARKKNQQEGFDIKWALVAFVVYLVLQAVVLVLLPMVIDAYDPQGLPGLLISAGVWFVGGSVVGFISPGKTFIEPAVGALLAVVPTLLWLNHIADVHQLSLLANIVGGMIGVMVTLLGGFLGEKIQMSTRGHN